MNVDGQDALFANMVNGGTHDSWWVPGNPSLAVPTDANFWPEADTEVFLGEGDTTTEAGGAYLVQFTGMATVTDWPQTVDWLVDGTDLQSSTLQAGQGYNPTTNTTTATMVVPPGPNAGFYMYLTNTSRNANSPLAITGISDSNGNTVTVSVSSVAGIAANQEVTIAGFTGSAASTYNGTFVITSVNTSNNTFTYTGGCCWGPVNPSGGTALVDPQNGITNLYVMQPTTLGGNTSIPVGTLFNPSALSMLAQYSVLRFMGLNATDGTLTSNWSDRTLVAGNFWSGTSFNSQAGVDTGVTGAYPQAGVPWEVQIALANETGKDAYINIPVNASASYLTNLANLFAYGSNGVTPYTSVQANPVWAPLDPSLKVYIEFSNELWNSGFVQAEFRFDGWANQLSQRALYDYLTNNQNDPLYPGGGSNAYNDGAPLASYYGVNSTNDSYFLSTYNANPASFGDGGSPQYFSNSGSINGYLIGEAWVGLRDVEISDAFKTAFGETNVNAAATVSRVRPLFEWQAGGNETGALNFISAIYGAQHPVSYYLYGGGGAWYADNTVDGFSDVSFTDPAFAGGLTGWSSSGSAGVVANGSSMGNPSAPPLFSAIAVTNGANESGNTATITTSAPHNFLAGQWVNVAGVAVSGYNGTFMITSVTPTTFTFDDSSTGLASSGDGTVSEWGTSGQAAYLQPGASISQNVTFSGGYADIALFATQSVAPSLYYYNGLFITLTPTNGGPAIDDGQPIALSEGAGGNASFSGSDNEYVWDRSESFYTGASDYTYTVTFTSTLPSGTVYFDDVAIQTVNGMFNETTTAVQSTVLNISSYTQSDVFVALQFGLHDVGYEGGFDFNQNLSSEWSLNAFQSIDNTGYSSSIPNVGESASLDPRTVPLAIETLNEFFDAGGTVAVVEESSANINSWAVSAPDYFNWDTAKLKAVASVEQTAQPATYGLTPGQSATSAYAALGTGPGLNNALESTYLIPTGSYALTMTFENNWGAPAGQTDSLEVLVDGQLIDTVNVPVSTGGTFTVPVGQLVAGQYSVVLVDTAPTTNAWIMLGTPGTPIYTLGYASTSVAWVAPSPIVYGTALGSSQLDATANVPGTFSYSPAAGAILGAGLDILSVTFTPTNITAYSTVSDTVTIHVLPATPTISWPNPANVVYGTALGSTQLDATANVAGTFAYAPSSGMMLKPGNGQTLSVTFTPTDTTDYTIATATATVTIIALPATPTISWPNPANIVYGMALGSTQLDATANVAGTFAYAPASGTVLKAGNGQTLIETFTPTDTTDYTTDTATVTIDVARATLIITATGVNKVYGETSTAVVILSDNRVTSDTFTDSYTSASFTSKNVGTDNTVNVSGISISGPGAANYTFNTTATTTASIAPAPLTIAAVSNTKIYDGTTSAAAVPIVSGLKGSDTVSNLSETYNTPAVGTGKTLSVATYTVNDGNNGDNYAINLVQNSTGVIEAAAAGSASFLKSDTTTAGNWIGVYGTQGDNIIAGPSDYPSYATVTPAGESEYTWSTAASDPRALQTLGSSARVAAGWWSGSSFTVDVNLTDGQTHDITLYALDYDYYGRNEQIQITSAATGAVLSTETISNFSGGVYLEWAVSGNVVITFTNTGGPNAILNGIFFDPAASSAKFSHNVGNGTDPLDANDPTLAGASTQLYKADGTTLLATTSSQASERGGVATEGNSIAISGNLVDTAIDTLYINSSDSQAAAPIDSRSTTPSGLVKDADRTASTSVSLTRHATSRRAVAADRPDWRARPLFQQTLNHARSARNGEKLPSGPLVVS